MFLPTTLTFKDPVLYVQLNWGKNSLDYVSLNESETVSRLLNHYASNGGFDYYRIDDLICFDIADRPDICYIARCQEEELNVVIKTVQFDRFVEIMQDSASLKEKLEKLKKM